MIQVIQSLYQVQTQKRIMLQVLIQITKLMVTTRLCLVQQEQQRQQERQAIRVVTIMVAKKYCSHSGCKRLVNLNERYCDKHKLKDSHVSKTSDYANKIHSSSRWRRTSLLYREANPLCEQCLREAEEGDQSRKKGLGMINLATSVDHIKSLADGGDPFNWDNLQSLCDYHHSKKSQAEREQKK